MSFYIDDYIVSFWETFEKCYSKREFVQLLEKVELMCIEHITTLEGDEHKTFFDESPLLAMISEVQRVCPEAVLELVDDSIIFSTAYCILAQYDEDDRNFLRRHFLKKDDSKIVYLDFSNRK